MNTYAATLILPLLCALSAAGQAASNAVCPSVMLTGPVSGFVSPGEPAMYTAKIDAAGKNRDLTFIWTAIANDLRDNKSRVLTIESGQGTPRITVRQPHNMLTVSVELKGLPPGCPNKASESSVIDWAPPAEKLYQIVSATAKPDWAELRSVASTLTANPNSQLFIIRGSTAKRLKATGSRLEEIIRYLASEGLGKDHITVISVSSEVNVLQFWRVPPGAENPKCDACGKMGRPTEAP